jgi:hypothetical protein
MGYRSEVKGLIYGTKEEMQAFKESIFDLYNQVREDFANEITDETNSEFELLYLNSPYTKWYDEYDEVQRWEEFYYLASQFGLNTEFIRIGENPEGDIEVNAHGMTCKYYLELIQRVDANFKEAL